MTDNEVLTVLRGNAEQAEAEILDRHTPLIIREANRYAFLGHTIVEDMLQEGAVACLKAIRGYARTNGGRPFFPYAQACIKNRLANVLRHANRRGLVGDRRPVSMDEVNEAGTLHDVIPAPAAPHTLTMREIWTCIEGMPARDRAILEGRYREGLTFAELGSRHGITASRAKQIERAALAQVRRLLHELEPVG